MSGIAEPYPVYKPYKAFNGCFVMKTQDLTGPSLWCSERFRRMDFRVISGPLAAFSYIYVRHANQAFEFKMRWC